MTPLEQKKRHGSSIEQLEHSPYMTHNIPICVVCTAYFDVLQVGYAWDRKLEPETFSAPLT